MTKGIFLIVEDGKTDGMLAKRLGTSYLKKAQKDLPAAKLEAISILRSLFSLAITDSEIDDTIIRDTIHFHQVASLDEAKAYYKENARDIRVVVMDYNLLSGTLGKGIDVLKEIHSITQELNIDLPAMIPNSTDNNQELRDYWAGQKGTVLNLNSKPETKPTEIKPIEASTVSMMELLDIRPRMRSDSIDSTASKISAVSGSETAVDDSSPFNDSLPDALSAIERHSLRRLPSEVELTITDCDAEVERPSKAP